ncbi:MAG: kelch repeat-containing protein [Pseudomonadota bacterium]
MITRRSLMTSALAAGALTTLPRTGRAEGGAWSSAAAMPYAVQEVYPALHDGQLYIAGGIATVAKSRDGIALTQVYDPGRDAWTIGPDLPERRHHNKLISAEGTLYSIGGYRGSPPRGVWQMKPAIWALGDARWHPAGTQPQPQAEQVAAVIDGRIHSVGGRSLTGDANQERGDHADMQAHWVWDVSSNTWDKAAPASVARNSAAGGVIDGRLYVAGGREEFALTGLTEVYDPAEDRWRSLAPMPQGQAGLAGAVLDGKLYVFGGEAVFTDNDGVFAEAWVYDPTADAWSALPAMPTPRHGTDGVALAGRIHVVGGARQPGGNDRSPAHEILTPA